MLSSRVFTQAARASARRAVAAPRALSVPSIRTYATPAGPDSKPPVALYGLDGTYASALVCGISILASILAEIKFNRC
jgi:F-type H+-transporting ATPase subunit O